MMLVSPEQLQDLAAMLPQEPPKPVSSYGGAGESFDLERWIVEHAIEVRYHAPWGSGEKWVLARCVWNPEHTDKSAFILRHQNGAMAAGCHHNSCQGKGWPDLREIFEPGYRDRRQSFGGAYSPARPGTNGHHSSAEETFHGLAGDAALLGGEPELEQVRLKVTSLKDVVPEQVKPLWPKRIFRGKLAVMAGDPGVGKSYASLDIAARVSLGGPWPDGSGNAPKGNVLLLSAEDGLADTVKPRLALLGADMDRISSLGLTVYKGDEETGLSLQKHVSQIEQCIVEKEIILMVVDPLLGFTGNADTHKSSDVRALLSPLAAMAERTGCAILAVMHPNKNSQEGNALYRISASLDFAAAARSVMVVAKHPDDPEQRVMATIKCNLTAHPEPMAFGFTHDGCFTWKGVAEVDVSQLMAPPVRDEDRNELQEAISFLQTLLADGPIAATQAEAERKEMGISERTLRRAKAALGVESARFNKEGSNRGKGEWRWYMPENVQGGQTTCPTVGRIEDSRSNGHSPATEERVTFSIANGHLEDSTLGRLEKNDSEGETSTNPIQTFKAANPGDRTWPP